jgi:lipocalin-like protein
VGLSRHHGIRRHQVTAVWFPAQGFVIFDSNDRFSYLLARPGRAKFAANSRDKGTPEENKATVEGSLAYSGTYSVTDRL